MNDITFCDQNYHILRIRNGTLDCCIIGGAVAGYESLSNRAVS